METPPQLPDLTLLRRIGTGSYGDVWIARTLTGVYRAVKIVDRTRFADDRPFQRELEGISRFQRAVGDQPSQLALLHVGRIEPQGLLYYVMELADDVDAGTDIDPEKYEPLTLKSLRSKRPILPAAEVVRLGVELTRGLAGLHAAGLIHRDVKPSNIILVNGVPKLADIGLVTSREVSVTSLGTPGYSPPEGAGSLSADLWGLGRVLYELVTGLSTREFPRLPADFDRRPDAGVLLELNEVVTRACEPEAKDRYPSAQAMLDELLLVQAGRSVKDLNRTRARLRTLARVAGIAAAIALAVIIGLGVKNYFTLRELAATEAAARAAAERDERLARYTANLHVAQLAFVNGDVGVARAALRREIPAEGATDLRGLEWYALWNETAGNATRVFGEVGNPGFDAVALSPDASQLATLRGTSTRELVLWNLATGGSRVLASGVRRIGGFTADGTQLAVGLVDGTLRLLTVATGQTSDALLTDVRVIHHAGDGRGFLLGSPNQLPTRLSVWDVVSQTEIGAWQPAGDLADAQIIRAAVSPDRRLIGVAVERGANATLTTDVIVWDQTTQSLRFRLPNAGRVGALAFSPDSAQLAVAASFQPVRVFDTADGLLGAELAAVPPILAAVEFSPGGRRVACAGVNGSIQVVDLETGNLLADLRGHESVVEKVAWAASDDRLYSAGSDGTSREWQIPAPPRVVVRGGFWRDLLGNPVWMPDGRAVLATLADGNLYRVDPVTLEPQGASWNAFHAFGVAPEGVRALNAQRELVILNPGDRSVQPTGLRLEGTSAIYVAASSRDASVAMLGEADGTVTIWDVANRRVLVRERRHASSVWACAVSSQGDWAATGDEAGRVWLWHPRDGRALREIPSNGLEICYLAISDDGSRCLVYTREGEMSVWRLDSQVLEYRSLAHTQGGAVAVFSADGSRLVTGGYDGMLLVWSVPEFRQLATLSYEPRAASRGAICTLALSPNGNALIAFTEDGMLRRWNLTR